MSPSYWRRPELVDARQLNATDWTMCVQTAQWCGGTLANLDGYLGTWTDAALMFLPGGANGFFAHDGDWVIAASDGFRIVAPEAFERDYFESGRL